MKNTELTLPEGLCAFSRGALYFARTPTQEEWEQIGRYVHAARGSSLRWMADWRREGRRYFGDTVVENAEKQLEFEFRDLKAAEAIEKLDGYHPYAPTDAHAFVAGKLCDSVASAEEWLIKASEQKLTPLELQKSIKAGEIVRESDENKKTGIGSGSSGVLTLEAIHMDFIRWNSRVKDDGFPGEWDVRRLGMVADLLEPFLSVRKQAVEKLSVLVKAEFDALNNTKGAWE
jgi:hypothetical protein